MTREVLSSRRTMGAPISARSRRVTRGNFRLLERPFPKITRVLKINQLETLTDDGIKPLPASW